MTNEFKIGDRVRYKNTEVARLGHSNGEIYTIRDIDIRDSVAIAYFKEAEGGYEINRLELVEPATPANKHRHFYTIMQWATDPTNTVVQFRISASHKWEDIAIGKTPSWFDDYEYRIKPKTKIVHTYQYAFFSNTRNETSIGISHFTDEMWADHANRFNISSFVRLDWTREVKEVPMDS